MFFINTEKLSAVELYCPSDVWLSCNAEIWNLSIYGNAYYIKNGYQYDAGSPSVVYDLTTCNTGVIYRTWTIEDQYWNLISCTQTIHVGGGNFNSTHIFWPQQDLHLYGCGTSTHPNDLPYGYGYPEYAYVSCSHIGTSYKDQVFTFGPDCKKILRKWTLIDWCNYIPGSTYQGIFSYTQIIKISNSETPILSCPKTIEINATECDSMYVNTPLVSVDGMSCTGNYEITNNSIFANIQGADASGKYPIGTTVVDYLVEYACGREKACRTEIIVKDKKPAVPYCYATLNVSLMPQDTDQDGLVDDGMVEVWAKDLDVNSYHPCNNGPLKFTFSSDLTDTYRIFTCAEVGPNVLQMWVTDKKGNQSYCVVTINIQNNAANIPDCEYEETGNSYALFGRITDEEDHKLENVVVYVKDKNAIYDYDMAYDTINEFAIVDSFYNQANALIYVYEMTTAIVENILDSTPMYNVLYLKTGDRGVYGSNDILYYRDYKINAFKEGDMSVVTFDDLALLEAHINGTKQFANPYSFLAADINEDYFIDQEDVDLLRALIEGEEDEWPKERQWVFYNKAAMMKMSEQPLEDRIPNTVEIDNFISQEHELDFIGILKGDIDKHESNADNDIGQIDFRGNIRNNDLQVFPNPFTETLYINVPKNDGSGYVLRVFDTKGTLILEKNLSDSRAEHIIKESKEWGTGSYLYQLISETQIRSGKLIKI
jgi:hypothetical protein